MAESGRLVSVFNAEQKSKPGGNARFFIEYVAQEAEWSDYPSALCIHFFQLLRVLKSRTGAIMI